MECFLALCCVFSFVLVVCSCDITADLSVGRSGLISVAAVFLVLFCLFGLGGRLCSSVLLSNKVPF